VGRILGPSFDEDRVPDAVAAIVGLYVHRRKPDESFGDAVARLGVDVFKRELYAAA
jgi:sulfite reductase (NADPH) hemoprotein beta-component